MMLVLPRLAPALTAGRSYAWWDEAAAEASYWLEEIDLNGQRVMHGPISPRAVDGPPPAEGRAAALGRLGQGRPMVRPVLREPEMATTMVQEEFPASVPSTN